MKKINVRELALEALEKLEQNQAYSNLLLTSVIKTNTLSDQDRGLLTELVYGTLQNKNRFRLYAEAFYPQAE